MLHTLMIVVLALFSLWAAVAAALAFGMHPAPMILALTLGYTLSVVIVTHLGAPLCRRLCPMTRAGGLPARVFRRYGLIGLGLAAPVLTGGAIGAALGLMFHVSPRRLVIWMAAGAALWSVLLALPAF